MMMKQKDQELELNEIKKDKRNLEELIINMQPKLQ